MVDTLKGVLSVANGTLSTLKVTKTSLFLYSFDVLYRCIHLIF